MLMLDDDNRRSVVADAPDFVCFTLHQIADTGFVEKRRNIISFGCHRISLVVITDWPLFKVTSGPVVT